ncbi:ABC transporter ATP-binding protein [Pendulispora albinea]|uniref:ABC transporter ATP-binding protein n=1 Tax=Pendulispora albinea TaxID=2741071 RepID=A0ABZ2M6H4_9BACT
MMPGERGQLGQAGLLIAAHGIKKSFVTGQAETEVLHGVDLCIQSGHLALVMGPSGSGKTTLLSILAGLLRPSDGYVDLCGERMTALPPHRIAELRRRRVGFVFQTYNLFPALTALENVMAALRMKGAPAGDARARALHCLERVGLAELVARRPGQLSGGQRQRVAVARALATAPSLLFGDEITAALDPASGHAVMRLLREHADLGHAVLIVTHDARLKEYADHVIEMQDGYIVRERYTHRAESDFDPFERTTPS